MEPMPEDWGRGLAVAAHPDDLEYGVASAVARWTGQGKQISYLLVTDGEAGIEGMAPEESGPLRQEEERRGAALVGVFVIEFLNHPDGLVEYGIGLRRDVAAVIRRLQPDVVFTLNFDLTWGPNAPVNHADHRAVGLAVLDACRDAANSHVFPDAGERWPGVKAVYVAAAPDPTHYVDVAGTIDQGVASLQAHEAYLSNLSGDFDADAFLRGSAAAAGEAVGSATAITFRQYPV